MAFKWFMRRDVTMDVVRVATIYPHRAGAYLSARTDQTSKPASQATGDNQTRVRRLGRWVGFTLLCVYVFGVLVIGLAAGHGVG